MNLDYLSSSGTNTNWPRARWYLAQNYLQWNMLRLQCKWNQITSALCSHIYIVTLLEFFKCLISSRNRNFTCLCNKCLAHRYMKITQDIPGSGCCTTHFVRPPHERPPSLKKDLRQVVFCKHIYLMEYFKTETTHLLKVFGCGILQDYHIRFFTVLIRILITQLWQASARKPM